MKNIIYVLGNPHVLGDKMPPALLPKFQELFRNFSFISYDPTEEIEEIIDKTLIFIDTVKGIGRTYLYSNLDYFKISPRNTVHDFDLPVALSLLKKLGKVEKIRIIGIPDQGNKVKILKEIASILRSILPSENARRSSCRGQKP